MPTLKTVDRGITRLTTPGRPDRYRVNLRTGAGRLSKVFPTLLEATAARDRWLAGDLPATGAGEDARVGDTLEDEIYRYADALAAQDKDQARVRQLLPMLRRLAPALLERVLLCDGRSTVLAADFWTVRHAREATGNTPQTIASDLGRLRSVIRHADPGFSVPDDVFPQKPAPRLRELTEAQARAVFALLGEPFRAMAMLATLTAMRQGEIRTLTRPMLQLEGATPRIELTRAKEGSGRTVWLGPQAVRVLRGVLRARPAAAAPSLFVFPNPRGLAYSPVHITREWTTACDRAGLVDFHFHDLRHHAAMVAAANGASDRELMEIGGWRSTETIKKYAQARPANVRRLVALVEESTAGVRHALRGPAAAPGRRATPGR